MLVDAVSGPVQPLNHVLPRHVVLSPVRRVVEAALTIMIYVGENVTILAVEVINRT
jgi:hypothetical protein